MIKFKPALAFALVFAAFAAAPFQAASAEKTAEKPARKKSGIARGARLFQTHCASCHAGGGNKVNPKTPLEGSGYLVAYPLFKTYLNEPLGDMPHYTNLIKNDEVLMDLHSYVKKNYYREEKKETPKSDKSKGSGKGKAAKAGSK